MKTRRFSTTAATIAIGALFGWLAANCHLSPIQQADAALPTAQSDVRPAVASGDAGKAGACSPIRYDARFFQSRDRMVQGEPWLPRDRAMIDQLKSIGIEKGKRFNPDAKTMEILNPAALEAKALLEQRYDEGFPPFYPGSRWGVPALPAMIEAIAS